jgi:hypothetical protein
MTGQKLLKDQLPKSIQKQLRSFLTCSPFGRLSNSWAQFVSSAMNWYEGTGVLKPF